MGESARAHFIKTDSTGRLNQMPGCAGSVAHRAPCSGQRELGTHPPGLKSLVGHRARAY
jgi:hypothetical protein